MSNALAVATVTATIQKLLFSGLNTGASSGATTDGTTVTVRPPDRARVTTTGDQINVFLYQTGIEAAWRNMDLPTKVKPGETGRPPLPLILNYLVTAYADGDDDLVSHRLLGRAMSVLHDHPTLGLDDLQAAIEGGDVHEQVERVHVTPQAMSIEELSKLWTTFQSPLRISAAYQACVVLIESTIPPLAPLPVLARGPADEGPVVAGSLKPAYPRITAVAYVGGQPSAVIGSRVSLAGRNLGGGDVGVVVTSRRLSTPVALMPVNTNDTLIEADLPADPAALPAGDYELTASIGSAAGVVLTTPPVVMSLAPRITAGLPGPVAAGGDLSLTCEPNVLEEQSVSLIVGATVVPGIAVPPDRVEFGLPALSAGDHLVRLRIDGVDSHLVDRSTVPPTFDASQVLTVQ